MKLFVDKDMKQTRYRFSVRMSGCPLHVPLLLHQNFVNYLIIGWGRFKDKKLLQFLDSFLQYNEISASSRFSFDFFINSYVCIIRNSNNCFRYSIRRRNLNNYFKYRISKYRL